MPASRLTTIDRDRTEYVVTGASPQEIDAEIAAIRSASNHEQVSFRRPYLVGRGRFRADGWAGPKTAA